MRYRLLLSTALAIPAIVFACSYGNYDGRYDAGAGDGGAEASAGRVVVSRAVDATKDDVFTTPDGAFEMTVPKGALPAGTAITISRLADRSLENILVVPVYTVSAPVAPTLPVQLIFRGNNPAGGDNTRGLVIAARGADETYAPVTFVGGALQQGGGPLWALTKKLETFSLVFVSATQAKPFTDVVPTSCLGKCCAPSGGGGGGGSSAANGAVIGGGCACLNAPNLACFVEACADLDAVIDRCQELANNPNGSVACKPTVNPGCTGGGMCGFQDPCSITTPTTPGIPSVGGGGICCMQGRFSVCSHSACPGMAIRCDKSTVCPGGTTCCVFENEAFCTSSCSTGRTWCTAQSDCDGGVGDGGPVEGGACALAPSCPHGTCGEPPIGCLLK